jgi:hypothetical protein
MTDEDKQAIGTPASTWRANGEPDPHGTRYNCERASLVLGDLTDDELANGAYLYYDVRMSVEDMLNPKPGQHMPIIWMTAVRDRIRWLSRALTAKPVEPSMTSPQLQASIDWLKRAQINQINDVITDGVMVQLFYAASGDISQFRIKGRKIIEEAASVMNFDSPENPT